MATKKKTTTKSSKPKVAPVIEHPPLTPAKLAEDQAKLDNHKYFLSIEAGKDKSGDMPYCYGCRYRKDKYCTISHDERVIRSACSANAHGVGQPF